jgi:transcriptional regulator with XRE-family HTH domain
MKRARIVKKLGLVVAAMRESRKLTQEKLAEGADISREHLSLIERGKRAPTLPILFSIAEVLGVKPSAIVERVERND